MAPSDQGTQITGYKVYLRKFDLAYSLELNNCDGSDAVIQAATQCTIPLTTLTAEPFSLQLGNSIYAKVIAYNLYGDSASS